MFKHTVAYENFFGVATKKTLYFHIRKVDAIRMAMEESEMHDREGDEKEVIQHLGSRIQNIVSGGNGKEIWDLFQWLLRNAYGEIGEDGETFEQSDELFDRWIKTASYDTFMNELFDSATLSTDFVNNIFPFAVVDPNEDPEFKRHREELEKRRQE